MTNKREKTSGRESGAKVAEGSLPSPDDEWSKLSQREKFIRTAREVGAALRPCGAWPRRIASRSTRPGPPSNAADEF